MRALLYVAIGLVVWEMCARLDDALSDGASLWGAYDYTNMLTHDEMGITGRPKAHYQKWKLNSLGFRGPEPHWNRERIICVGSSETFGLFEKAGMEYPRQLERAMNTLAGSERYDVENTAYAGQNLGSFTKRVEKVIATVRPRMAVIYPSLASYIDPPSANNNWVPIEDPPFKLRMVKKFFDSLDRLPEWVRTLRHQLRIWRFTRNTPTIQRIPEENVELFHHDLSLLLDKLQRGNIQPVLVTHATVFGSAVSPEDRPVLIAWRSFYPKLDDSGFLDAERRLNDVVRQEAAARSLILVDAASTLHGRENFGDFVHFSDRGASLLAREIAAGILKTGPPKEAHGHDIAVGRTVQKTF